MIEIMFYDILTKLWPNYLKGYMHPGNEWDLSCKEDQFV